MLRPSTGNELFHFFYYSIFLLRGSTIHEERPSHASSARGSSESSV